jgi:glutamate-1-semialdehyde 2,1-aminomutase
LGKIIGGGLPVGAYGGRAEIMDMIAPSGPVYQAGTLSGNPLATTAGLAILNLITNDLAVYDRLEEKGKIIADGIRKQVNQLGKNYTVNQLGSMITLFFTERPVNNFNDAKTSDLSLFAQYFQGMLRRGVYLPPSQFESWFISDAIQDEEINQILLASEETLTEMFS